jgi:hypothetical protein
MGTWPGGARRFAMHPIAPCASAPNWTAAMRAGDWERAWTLSESVLFSRDPATRDDPRLPYHLRWVWDGTPPDGRHVLVRCYHGLGDVLQFARYLPELARRAASVTVEVCDRLICLLADFPVRLVPFDQARPLPRSDCDIEIMELALALRVAPDAGESEWLRTDGFTFPAGTTGLCLSSGEWDPARSVDPEWFSARPLQRPCIALDLGCSSLAVLNPGGCPADLAATASFIAGCEAIVTVDTMVAHMAGSMGKPTWLMLRDEPDWRWVPGAETSAWYASLRLVHQREAGDWAPVVAQVRAEVGL